MERRKVGPWPNLLAFLILWSTTTNPLFVCIILGRFEEETIRIILYKLVFQTDLYPVVQAGAILPILEAGTASLLWWSGHESG